VVIGGGRKGDSVSRSGWKLSARGFLKRIGSVQRRAQTDVRIAVEKDDGLPETAAFGELDPNSGGSFLTDTRPRPAMREEGVVCDFAVPEIDG
jgi:hypothetical protein